MCRVNVDVPVSMGMLELSPLQVTHAQVSRDDGHRVRSLLSKGPTYS